MARTPRQLTAPDLSHWAEYVQQVKPLRGQRPPALLPPALPPQPVAPVPVSAGPAPPALAKAKAKLPVLQPGISPGGIDRATWQRFHSRHMPAERRLDLHGHTAQRAHQEVQEFLRQAAADGLRCVEVITGRGSAGRGSGVIREEFPHWINQPDLRRLILGASPSNQGAVRLLLRRRR